MHWLRLLLIIYSFWAAGRGAVITGGVVPKLSGLIDKSEFKEGLHAVQVIRKNFLTKFQFGCQLIQCFYLLGAQSAPSNTFLRSRLVLK